MKIKFLVLFVGLVSAHNTCIAIVPPVLEVETLEAKLDSLVAASSGLDAASPEKAAIDGKILDTTQLYLGALIVRKVDLELREIRGDSIEESERLSQEELDFLESADTGERILAENMWEEERLRILEDQSAKKIQREKAAEAKAWRDRERKKEEARIAKARKNYSPEIADRIVRETIWLGMTEQMARDSIGDPDDINRTVTRNLVSEQWIYRRFGKYLYFKNGILESWQE